MLFRSNAVDDVKKAMEGLLAPKLVEKALGKAEVRQVFKVGKVAGIAGCMVLDGTMKRSSKARVVRDSVQIWEGKVSGLRCQRMELGEPDESGRRAPVCVMGSEFTIDCDTVISAVGTRANPLLRKAGEWNDGRILVQQGRVQHWLNAVQVVDAPCRGPEWDRMVAESKFRDWPFGKSPSGRIALQDHGDEVAYRNIRILRL